MWLKYVCGNEMDVILTVSVPMPMKTDNRTLVNIIACCLSKMLRCGMALMNSVSHGDRVHTDINEGLWIFEPHECPYSFHNASTSFDQ